MRTTALAALASFVLVALAAGCHAKLCGDSSVSWDGDRGGSSGSGPYYDSSQPADASRAIAEADIVQLDEEQHWIYAMSKSGSLAIVDATTPRALSLLGKSAIPGQPFEMYRRGNVLFVMSNHGVLSNGAYVPIVRDSSGDTLTPTEPDPRGGALLTAVDVTDPAHMTALGTFAVPGEVADSRMVGNILYLVTFENGSCWSCSGTPRTVVTTFDLSSPTAPAQIDQLDRPAPGGRHAWPTPWKRSILATPTRLYIGGLSEASTSTNQGVIEALDISDPTGHLTVGAKIVTAGPITSRWQMDEYQGVLRVISQRGAGLPNGLEYPDVDTFRVESSQSIVRIGHTTMNLPQLEGLKSVRFDGTRAYAITFETVIRRDPLFTIDLSDPTQPIQRGELDIPGWVYHLEPRGDRIVALGLEPENPAGSLNVSLFDVSNMDSPSLLVRQSFGPTNVFTDQQVTEAVIAEDQDRIQKAFRVFPDGLVVVPYSGLSAYGSSCSGAVQLFDVSRDTLVKRGFLTASGNPRRALRLGTSSDIIAISDAEVSAFSIENRDAPAHLSSVTIGTCVDRRSSGGGGGWEGSSGWEGNDTLRSHDSCE